MYKIGEYRKKEAKEILKTLGLIVRDDGIYIPMSKLRKIIETYIPKNKVENIVKERLEDILNRIKYGSVVEEMDKRREKEWGENYRRIYAAE